MLFQTDIDVDAFTAAVVDRFRTELDRAVDATGRSLLCIGPVNIEDPPAPKGLREVGVVRIEHAEVERRGRADGKNFRPLDEPGGLGVRRVQLVVYLRLPLFTREELATAGTSVVDRPALIPQVQLRFDLLVDRMADGTPCLRARFDEADHELKKEFGKLLLAVNDALRPVFDANPICEPIEVSALNDLLGFDATTGWTRGGVSAEQ